MSEEGLTLPTYRYVLRVDGKVVYHSFTMQLDAKLRQYKHRCPRTVIEQVGERTTYSDEYRWA